jgi:hypothetical protein
MFKNFKSIKYYLKYCIKLPSCHVCNINEDSCFGYSKSKKKSEIQNTSGPRLTEWLKQ